MFNSPNLYYNFVAVYCVLRHMLFNSSVDCSWYQLCHLLSAAHYRNSCILYFSNNIPAMLANIKFLFHNVILPFALYIH